jgi:hypothetical protein
VAGRLDWFPNWEGASIAIVASGPSTKGEKLAFLDRLPVLAIKENVDLLPNAAMVYGCDGWFWKNRLGLPKYKGIKVSWDAGLRQQYHDIKLIEINKHEDRILTGKPGLVGSGGNSGFQAVNLAVQCGVKRILLVGFDMHSNRGLHWYGRNNGMGRNNPGEDNFKRWIAAFNVAAVQLRQLGVEVVNGSKESALSCFTKLTIERALNAWELL